MNYNYDHAWTKQAEPDEAAFEALAIGARAPNIVGVNLDGSLYNLDQSAGRIVVAEFGSIT